jgi:O-antigen ligase
MLFQYLTQFFLFSALLLSPIPFGSVQPWAYGAMEILVFLALLVWLLGSVKKGEIRVIHSSLYLPLFLFIVLVALQALNLRPIAYSLYRHPTRISLLKLLCYSATFFLIVNTWNYKTRRRLVTGLLFIASLMCIYGLLQYGSGGYRIFGYLRPTQGRLLSGTFVNPNHFAAFLEMTIPLGIALLLSRGTRRGKNSIREIKKVVARGDTEALSRQLLLGFVIIILTLSLILTAARGGITSFLVAISFMPALLLRSRIGKRAFLALSTILLLVFLYAMWVGLEPVFAKFSRVESELYTINGRLPVWRSTLALSRDHLLSGTGLGTYVHAFRQYKPVGLYLGGLIEHAHNDYLELLAETGITGLLLFIWLILSFLRSIKMESSTSIACLVSVIAILLHSLTDFSLQIPANVLLFSALLGMGTIGGRQKSHSLSGLKCYALGILASVICLFLIASSIKPPRARHYYNKYKDSLSSGEPQGEYLKKAISFSPKNSEYHFELGQFYSRLAYEGKADFETFSLNSYLALNSYREAARLNTLNPYAHLALGLRSGDGEEFSRAISLDPGNPYISFTVADHYLSRWEFLNEGEREICLDALKHTLSADPKYFPRVLERSWEGIGNYSVVKEIIPPSSEFHYRFSGLLQEKGLWVEAEAQWREGRSLEGKPIIECLREEGNLILNGSFECTPGTAFGDWIIKEVNGARTDLDSSFSYDGKNSLRISFDGTRDVRYVHTYEVVPVEPEKGYVFSARMKLLGVSSPKRPVFELSDLRGRKFFNQTTKPVYAEDRWREISLDFATPPGCRAIFVRLMRPYGGGGYPISGTLWIDWVKLTEKNR